MHSNGLEVELQEPLLLFGMHLENLFEFQFSKRNRTSDLF